MNDREYFRARARQEQDKAARAQCPEGRRIHHELASRYLERAGERVTLHLVAG